MQTRGHRTSLKGARYVPVARSLKVGQEYLQKSGEIGQRGIETGDNAMLMQSVKMHNEAARTYYRDAHGSLRRLVPKQRSR
jgi:hypothetical protein